MLDIHPPEHTPHTWRDFLIHIATIVVGLIIAIGLEQTVVWIHHRQERHQLLEDIRGEGATNAQTCNALIAMLNTSDGVFDPLADAIRSAPVDNGHVTIVIPPLVRQREAVFVRARSNMHGAVLPTIPVWDTARDTQATSLLTPQSDRFFANLPYVLNWVNFDSKNALNASSAYDSILRSLTGQPSPILAPAQNTLTATPEQRERLLDAISTMQEATTSAVEQVEFFKSISSAVADGVQNDEQYNQWMARPNHHK